MTAPATAAPARPFETVADALGAGEHVEALAILFQDLALDGYSVPELVASAAYTATERLPRGMSLTDQRPGCWESDLFESMAPESAVAAGPGPDPLDGECERCGAGRDQMCWNPRTYVDNKHPHRERIEWAAAPERVCIGGEWC